GIAFAIVFLLVVGTTVAYLVFRPGGGGTPEAGTSPATESASVTDAGTDGTETSATPTEVEAERCWTPEQERTSDNPSGKLRGGGLQDIPPAIYGQRGTPLRHRVHERSAGGAGPGRGLLVLDHLRREGRMAARHRVPGRGGRLADHRGLHVLRQH